MRKIITVLTLCLLTNWGQTQILDVFLNKQYEVSTRVLSAEINKEYSPKKLEIYQDKSKVENETWTTIEDQLFTQAIQEIENEVAFFQLYNKALQFRNQFESWNSLQGNTSRNQMNPTFNKLKIELVSVLNNCGIYTANYKFKISSDRYGDKEVEVKKHYLADFEKNKITAFGGAPTPSQQKVLKELTLSKFNALYLLQTQKLDLNNLERIENIKQKTENGLAIESKLYYSEAVVYPYLSGIIVEFPGLSNSSRIFNYEPFRVYLKGDEVLELLTVYPEFKPAFKTSLVKSSASQVEQLNNDDNFDLARFRSWPKETEILKIFNFDQKVYAMKINMHQISDTVRRHMGSKKLYFDKNRNILLIEQSDENNRIYSEEKYTYNIDNQLTSLKNSSREQQLELYHYKNNILDYTEKFELDIEINYQETNVNLDVSQQHFVYNNNYRYTIALNLVGEFSQQGYTHLKFLEKNQFCTNSYCVLTDDNQNVIGIKQKRGSLIDVLMNSNNQPIESYIDNDRYIYFWTYDIKGRLTSFKTNSDKTSSSFVDYEYNSDLSKALIITEERNSYSNKTVIEYAYEFEFCAE